MSTLTRVYFHQKFFWVLLTSSVAPIPRCSLMKYETCIGSFSFKIAVLNIFGKFLEKHQWQRSILLSIVISFQYVLCHKLFSRNFLKIFRTAFSKNTADGMLLILSRTSFLWNISRTSFNPLTIGGNKNLYIL